MKKHSHLFIFLLLFTGVFFSECKKYPEDDVFIQCRRPEKRLIKYGPWVFDKLTVDGVDKSAEFRADSAYFDRIDFLEHAEYSTDFKVYRTFQRSEKGSFLLIDKIILSIIVLPALPNDGDFHNYGPIFKTSAVEWEILRLSKKGMTLKTNYSNSVFVLYMIPEN
jgi:hypothetical protein